MRDPICTWAWQLLQKDVSPHFVPGFAFQIRFLLERIKVPVMALASVVVEEPKLLGIVTMELSYTARWFLALGLQQVQLGEMAAEFPKLLLYHPDEMRAKWHYAKREMKLRPSDLMRFPR